MRFVSRPPDGRRIGSSLELRESLLAEQSTLRRRSVASEVDATEFSVTCLIFRP
jgi:hypothetical protein